MWFGSRGSSSSSGNNNSNISSSSSISSSSASSSISANSNSSNDNGNSSSRNGTSSNDNDSSSANDSSDNDTYLVRAAWCVDGVREGTLQGLALVPARKLVRALVRSHDGCCSCLGKGKNDLRYEVGKVG